jgi:integrase
VRTPQRGGVAALLAGDVDLMRRRIQVNRAMAEVRVRPVVGTPKDYEVRSVPVPAFLVDDLSRTWPASWPTRWRSRRRRAGSCETATSGGTCSTPRPSARACRASTPQGLRHTAASLEIAAGATVVLVSRMLGHSPPTVTLNVYARTCSPTTLAARLRDAGSPQVRTKCVLRPR